MSFALYKRGVILGVGRSINEAIEDALLYHHKNGMLTDTIMIEKINIGVSVTTFVGCDPYIQSYHPKLNISPCTDELFRAVLDGDNTHFWQSSDMTLHYYNQNKGVKNEVL